MKNFNLCELFEAVTPKLLVKSADDNLRRMLINSGIGLGTGTLLGAILEREKEKRLRNALLMGLAGAGAGAGYTYLTDPPVQSPTAKEKGWGDRALEGATGTLTGSSPTTSPTAPSSITSSASSPGSISTSGDFTLPILAGLGTLGGQEALSWKLDNPVGRLLTKNLNFNPNLKGTLQGVPASSIDLLNPTVIGPGAKPKIIVVPPGSTARGTPTTQLFESGTTVDLKDRYPLSKRWDRTFRYGSKVPLPLLAAYLASDTKSTQKPNTKFVVN